MRPVVAGFVDVGFVRATVADTLGVDRARVRLNASAIVHLVEEIATARESHTLRTYWYDGQYMPDDPRYTSQMKYLDAVANVPGLRLRLGQLLERTPAWHADLHRALHRIGVDPTALVQHFNFAPELVQKGVDTLMVLDLVMLSQGRAYDTAVLFTGDRDVSEAVRTCQDQGRQVVLVAPAGRSVAAPLRALADYVVTLTESQIRGLSLTSSARREAPAEPATPRPAVRSHIPLPGPRPVLASADPVTGAEPCVPVTQVLAGPLELETPEGAPVGA